MGKELEVIEQLKKYKEVLEVHLVYGVYDFLSIANLTDRDHALRFRNKLERTKGVKVALGMVEVEPQTYKF